MLGTLGQEAGDTLRRSGLAVAGGIFCAVGLGFATAAAWHGLVLWNGPIAAAAVLALLYLGPGLILLALSRKRREPEPPPMARLAAAFLAGLDAGARARTSGR